MIPNLAEIAERFGVNVVMVPLVLAALLTGAMLFAQSVARWFEDRNL